MSASVPLRGLDEKSRPDPGSMVVIFFVLKCIPIAFEERAKLSLLITKDGIVVFPGGSLRASLQSNVEQQATVMVL